MSLVYKIIIICAIWYKLQTYVSAHERDEGTIVVAWLNNAEWSTCKHNIAWNQPVGKRSQCEQSRCVRIAREYPWSGPYHRLPVRPESIDPTNGSKINTRKLSLSNVSPMNRNGKIKCPLTIMKCYRGRNMCVFIHTYVNWTNTFRKEKSAKDINRPWRLSMQRWFVW